MSLKEAIISDLPNKYRPIAHQAFEKMDNGDKNLDVFIGDGSKHWGSSKSPYGQVESLFNRFGVAMALEDGIIRPDTLIDLVDASDVEKPDWWGDESKQYEKLEEMFYGDGDQDGIFEIYRKEFGDEIGIADPVPIKYLEESLKESLRNS